METSTGWALRKKKLQYLRNLCLKGGQNEGEPMKVYAGENVEGRGMYKGVTLRLWENENEWVSVEWEGKSFWEFLELMDLRTKTSS